MKITMTMQEVAKYAGMAIDISGMEMTVAEAMKDVFKLAGNPEKLGYVEIGIDDNMNIYIEAKPEAVCMIFDIIAKYIKATLPLYKAMSETFAQLPKDLEDVYNMFSEKKEEKVQQDSSFEDYRETENNIKSESVEDFSELDQVVKTYKTFDADFDETTQVIYKQWYDEEDIDFNNLDRSHIGMHVYLKGAKYASVNVNIRITDNDKCMCITYFDLENIVRSKEKDKAFVAKLFNKITTDLQSKGFTIELDSYLADSLAEQGIIKFA